MSNDPGVAGINEPSVLWILLRRLGAIVGLVFAGVLLVSVLFWLDRRHTAQDSRSQGIEEQLRQLSEERDAAQTLMTSLAEQLESVKQSAAFRSPIGRSRREPAVDQSARAADAAIVRQLELGELKSRLDALDEQLAVLRTEANDWTVRVVSLQTDEPGRRLATRPDLVVQFAALTDQEHPSLPAIRRFQQDTQLLRTGLDQFFKADVTALPSEEYHQKLGDLETVLRTAARGYESDQALLKSLLALTATTEPAAETLAEAVSQADQARAQAQVQQLQTARQQAFDEGLRELSVQEQKRIRASIDLEILQSKGQTDQTERAKDDVLAKQRADEAAAAAAREQARLMREALRPEVLDLLAPLTAHDDIQPRQIVGAGAHGQQVARKEPVSLRRLKMLGVMEQNDEGKQKLVLLNSTNWTSRPRWPMRYEATEPSLWNDLQRDAISKTQEYLIKYGEVLVKAGKLAE